LDEWITTNNLSQKDKKRTVIQREPSQSTAASISWPSCGKDWSQGSELYIYTCQLNNPFPAIV
jgi:hypothetical protein